MNDSKQDINRIKVVLVEKNEQPNGLRNSCAKIKQPFQNGVLIHRNHH